jgi:hypothetical protein
MKFYSRSSTRRSIGCEGLSFLLVVQHGKSNKQESTDKKAVDNLEFWKKIVYLPPSARIRTHNRYAVIPSKIILVEPGTLPPGLYYLVTTNSRVDILDEKHGSGNPPMLSSKLYWKRSKRNPFKCGKRGCNKLQKLITTKPSPLAIGWRYAGDGALVFGGVFNVDPNARCDWGPTYASHAPN